MAEAIDHVGRAKLSECQHLFVFFADLFFFGDAQEATKQLGHLLGQDLASVIHTQLGLR